MLEKQKQSFKKSERLKSRTLISNLFGKGKAFYSHPFKIIWLETELPVKHNVQLLISVSKRNFPKAVDRNKIKRLLRESFRKNKSLLNNILEKNSMKCALAIIYQGKIIQKYNDIEQRMIKMIIKFENEANK